MFELGFSRALEFGYDALGEDFAQLNAPLVEGIDTPYCSLGENTVLVERNQFAQRRRRQPVGQNSVGRPITFEHPMRNEPIRRALRLYLIGRFAECECLGLREDVRDEHVVMPAKRIERMS